MLAISSNVIASLSQQQLDQFFNEGLVVIPNFFDTQEIKQVSDSSDRLYKQAQQLAKDQAGKLMYKGTQIVIDKVGTENEVLRIVWAGAAEPQVLKLSRQSKLLVPVGQILATDKADQLNNQLHYKFPNGGNTLTWYQDIRNRKNFDPEWKDLNDKGSFVLAIIAIDSLNVDKGTIYYVPKSHTRGDLSLDQINDPVELGKVAHIDEAVPLVLNPGDLVLWHPYLIHGSDPNQFSTPRRIFINGFSYPGANTKPYPGEGSAQSVSLR